LFIGVADTKNNNKSVATKQQQTKKKCVPTEFSEEYFYSIKVRTHNESVKKSDKIK